MAKCQHQTVSITIEFVDHVHCESFGEIDPPTVRIQHRQHGTFSTDSGYWSRAHIAVRCRDCDLQAWYTSVDWRRFPKWLREHWLRLVESGGLPAELHKHYRMFEEEPHAAVPAL